VIDSENYMEEQQAETSDKGDCRSRNARFSHCEGPGFVTATTPLRVLRGEKRDWVHHEEHEGHEA
jgi:hypothetical protein